MATSSTKPGKRLGRGSNEGGGQIDEAQRKVSVAPILPPTRCSWSQSADQKGGKHASFAALTRFSNRRGGRDCVHTYFGSIQLVEVVKIKRLATNRKP